MAMKAMKTMKAATVTKRTKAMKTMKAAKASTVTKAMKAMKASTVTKATKAMKRMKATAKDLEIMAHRHFCVKNVPELWVEATLNEGAKKALLQGKMTSKEYMSPISIKAWQPHKVLA